MKILLFVSFLLFGCSSFNHQDAKLKLRILHTNDHHGHYLADKDGQYGMAARKTKLDQLRSDIKKQSGGSLLLSGGDINTGTMESDVFDAKPDFLGMKKLGYDVMAIGNHEFDNDFKVLLQQKQWAGFPFLSANIFYKKTGKRVFDPAYIIKEINGVKVGIFGLTTIDTPFKASSDDAKKMFEFKPIIEAAKPIVDELKLKVDVVIAVTHIGHHGSETSNGDIKLAQAVDGIDVIVGGHSQEIINAEVHNNTIIVQAEDWGKYIGVLDLFITKEHIIADHQYKLEPINLKKSDGDKKVLIADYIEPNQEMIDLFKPFQEKAEKIGSQKVGILMKDLSAQRKDVRSKQMPIGQFIGECFKHQVSDVDLVVLNGGSIRGGLVAGDISRKDLHRVHPYGNTIATVKMSAQELFDYMSVVAKFSHVNPKHLIGGYPQISFATLIMKDNELIGLKDPEGKWSIEKVNGAIQTNKKSFTLGTMNFVAKGGDNYPKLTANPTYTDTGFMVNAAMMNYAMVKKKVDTTKFEKSIQTVFENK